MLWRKCCALAGVPAAYNVDLAPTHCALPVEDYCMRHFIFATLQHRPDLRSEVVELIRRVMAAQKANPEVDLLADFGPPRTRAGDDDKCPAA